MSAKFYEEAHNSLVSSMFTSLFPYLSIVTLTFNLWPPKSIGSILSLWLTRMPSLIKKHTMVYCPRFLVPCFCESVGTLNLIRLSVRPSIRLSVCHKNFNLGHNFCTNTDRALILGMCVPCDKTFPMVPCRDLDGDLWPTSRSNLLPSGGPQFSEFACPLCCSPAYFHMCLLRPWPMTSKINTRRVHPLTMANMYAKFDEEAHNGLVSIVFTSLFLYLSIVTFTFDLWSPKSIGPIL